MHYVHSLTARNKKIIEKINKKWDKVAPGYGTEEQLNDMQLQNKKFRDRATCLTQWNF